jgi:tryptophan-rich sensory protein
MNWGRLVVSLAAVLAAAVAGNVFVGREAQQWFRSLRWPRLMVPYPALIASGVVYYVVMAVVLYRALGRGDAVAVVLALVVLAGNEAWNVLWFGRRSLRGGFLGCVVFLVPLLALEVAVLEDAVSALVLALYVLWVGYDLVWLYQMWRLNEA